MNDFLHWLGKTDPNVVLPIVGLPIIWLWNKVRGDSKSVWGGIINKVVDNIVNELLDEYVPSEGDVRSYLQIARGRIDKAVWSVLQKRGVPRNKWTEAALHEAIERGTAWLGNEVAKIRIPYQLEELHRRLSESNEKLKSAMASNSGAVR